MKARTLIRVSIYLLLYLGLPVIASLIDNETVTAVVGIVYIFLLIPIGILRMIEFYRTNDDTTVLSRIFNVLFRVPLALLGLVCLVVGIGIVGWVLYNVFIERQKEYSGPSFIIGFGSFGVGLPLILYGWFTLRSSISRQEEVVFSPEEQEEFEHEEDDEEQAV
jgi:hypothetical protein